MAQEVIGLKVEVESNAGEQLGSLRSQIKAATQDLIAMRDKFGETSPEAAKAAQKVAELKEKMADAKQMADAFNPDKKFAAFAQTLTGVTSGFAAVQGAMGLFGTESKDLEKQLLKVQSALALAQGLNGVMEAKDAFLNLAVVLRTQVVAAFATMRTAIMTTGIGALVVTIGYLIGKYLETADAAEKVKEKEQELQKVRKEEIDQLKQIADANAKTRNLQIEAVADGVEKEKAMAKEKRDIALKTANDELKGNEESYLARQRYLEQSKAIEQIYQNDLTKIAENAEKDRQEKLKNIKKKPKLENQSKSDIIDSVSQTAAELAADDALMEQWKVNRESQYLEDIHNHNEAAKRHAEIAQLEAEARVNAINEIENALYGISMAIGQQTAFGKIAAFAQIAIDTALAISSLVKNSESNPGNSLTGGLTAVAQFATGIARITANIASAYKLLNTANVPSYGGGGSYGSGASFTAPILQPTMQTTVLNQSQLNLLGGQLMRAYVVESDITSSQQRTNRIQNAAEFGG